VQVAPPGCNGSTKAALRLAALGFQVKEMIGGVEWWERDGYDLVN
jgi:rhodanese-related sulfurtransferase